MTERANGNGLQPPVAIVDGSNVAHSTEGEGPRLENIVLVTEKLREEGYRPVVVVDEDIDVFDPMDVEWAIATRVQADRDALEQLLVGLPRGRENEFLIAAEAAD